MKISKRILGVALALIMIFNVFAIGTFAAFPDDTAVKLILSTDKASYAKGEDVIITFAAQSTEEIGKLSADGQWEIAYNSDVIVPYSADKALDSHGFAPVASQASGYVSAMSQVIPGATLITNGSSAVDEDGAAAYGWNDIMDVCVAVNGCYLDTISAPQEFFSIKMKIADDAADGTYTIGFNPDGYEMWQAYNSSDILGSSGVAGATSEDSGFEAANTWEYGTVTFTVGAAAPEKLYITHEGTQSKWANGTPVAADYLFGFLAKIDGIGELATTKDDATGKTIVNDIASITATATINGVTKTDDVQSIWVDGTGYKFRAQFADFTPDMTDEVSVTFVITMTDGTTVYETADAATATINGIYLQSVSNGLAELA